MADERLYFRVKALALTGRGGKLFRNKTSVKTEDGIKVVDTIVTDADFEGKDYEKLVESGHLEPVSEKIAEKNHQKKNGGTGSSQNATAQVPDPEPTVEQLKAQYLELGGDPEEIKASWGKPKFTKLIKELKNS